MSFEDVLRDVRKGKPIIIVDDPAREGEGDIFVAAERITPKAISFMATHGRGLVCMPITGKRAEALGFSLMVPQQENTEKECCMFTVSVDARDGTTTGISAYDRAVTVRKIVDTGARARDFRKPGHLFPLVAKDGGVLAREGHTEAAVDLARLAGLASAGVICEIMNNDGRMARGEQINHFAQTQRLRVTSVDEIKLERLRREILVEKIVDVVLPTTVGEFRLFAYKNGVTGGEELALVKGNVFGKRNVLVRVHSACLTGEVFGSLRCDCDEQLQTSMSIIARAREGIIIYLQQEGRGFGLLNKLHAYKLQEHGDDTVEANTKLGLPADKRQYWVAVHILRNFRISSVRLLTNNPEKERGLESMGIRVTERLELSVVPTRQNARYLNTKKSKMKHTMDIREKMVFV